MALPPMNTAQDYKYNYPPKPIWFHKSKNLPTVIVGFMFVFYLGAGNRMCAWLSAPECGYGRFPKSLNLLQSVQFSGVIWWQALSLWWDRIKTQRKANVSTSAVNGSNVHCAEEGGHEVKISPVSHSGQQKGAEPQLTAPEPSWLVCSFHSNAVSSCSASVCKSVLHVHWPQITE